MTNRQLSYFFRHVTKTEGCWIWSPINQGHRYGRIRFSYKSYPAHRIAYEHWIGPIPIGYEIDHTCFNPACVNPAHLEAVTQKVNAARVATKDRCRRGHLRTTENTYTEPSGIRVCRECRKYTNRRYYHERLKHYLKET